MKKIDTSLIKKETAIIVIIVAFVGGFLGGIVFSAIKSPSIPSQYSGPQPADQQSSQNNKLQANRLQTLEQEIVANPDNFVALIELGDIYFDSNRYQEAIATFNKAEKLAPNNIHILNDLGILYMNTGDYETSMTKFKAVLKFDPTHSHTLYYIGLIHRDRGETDKALQAFEEVLSLNPAPQLAETVRQEIAFLKDQALPK